MLIGSQAFQETPQQPRAGDRPGADAAPRRLGQDCRSTTRSAPPAPTPPRSASTSSAQVGVLYHGPGDRSAAARSSAARARRDRRLHHRPRIHEGRGFALAGAVLTFFGFMHGEAIGIGAVAGGGGQLSRHRRHPAGLRQICRPGATARRSVADARPWRRCGQARRMRT